MTISEERLREMLIEWLRKRALPDSGIRYYSNNGGGSAHVELHGRDATFVAEHFHGEGAAKLADALSLRSDAHTNGEVKAYVRRLLVSFVNEHCDPVPDWAPLPDLLGMLAQLDNALTIVRDIKAAAPAEWIDRCPDCGCRTKADIQRADGSPDGRVRCVECKRVFGSSLGRPIQGEAKPTGYAYELATRVLGAVTGIEGYASFEERISFEKPTVPDGAIRNLRPLFASPQPPTPAGVREITDEAVDRLAGVLFDRLGLSRFGLRLEDVKTASRAALAAAKGAGE